MCLSYRRHKFNIGNNFTWLIEWSFSLEKKFVCLFAATTFPDDDPFAATAFPDDDPFENGVSTVAAGAESFLMSQCKRVTGNDTAYKKADQAANEMMVCLKKFFNGAQVEEEKTDLESTQVLDMVIKKWVVRE
jgi:Protein of unknown function (DUF1397)